MIMKPTALLYRKSMNFAMKFIASTGSEQIRTFDKQTERVQSTRCEVKLHAVEKRMIQKFQNVERKK